MGMRTLFLLLSLIAALAGSGCATLSALLYWRLGVHRPVPIRHLPTPQGYESRGIDVSHHQGRIDWGQVATSGRADFAWIKATEGVSHRDRRFAHNWREARDNGVEVGAYHYFSFCRSGAEQAEHFISVVPRAWGTLPHAVDVELDSGCNRRVDAGWLDAELRVWLDTVEAHYGQRPVVYASSVFARDFLDLDSLQADLWVAAYTRAPSDELGWAYWQHTSRGTLPGIRGPVDLNVRR